MNAYITPTIESIPAAMLGPALLYVEKGWPVFPCSGKTPRTEHGFKNASRKPKQLLAWWREDPHLNIGVPMGAVSGLLGLDVDPRHGGDETLEALEGRHGRLPDTVVSLTGGGGVHHLLRHPGGTIKPRTLGPGVELKGDGSYLIFPPSRHPDTGRAYAWNLEFHPDDVPVAEPPAWILHAPDRPSTNNGESERPRHDRLRDLVWKLTGTLTEAEALTIARAMAESWGLDAKRDGEVERLVRGAFEKKREASPRIEVVDISSVEPEPPSWTVDGFVEQGKLSMWWAGPGVGKSYLALALVAQLMRSGSGSLWGHDGLRIRRSYRRVLWISGEESAGRVAWRWQRVRRGVGDPEGELLHVWAPGKPRVSLFNLPQLIEEHEPDAIVIDPLRVLLPDEWGERPVNWDSDTAACHHVAALIRGAAADRGADLFLLHHPRKAGDTYGGPVSWEAAVDVMVGLRRKGEVITACVEKLREGKRPEPFHLVLQHDDRDVRALLSTDPSARLSDRGRFAVRAVREAGGEMVQAELLRRLEAEFSIARPTAYESVGEALAARQLADSGRKIGNSPVLCISSISSPDSPPTVAAEDSP